MKLVVHPPVEPERIDRIAASAGAMLVVKPLADQFYGDRSGSVIDPFGHQWTIATHIEDVSPEELERRHDDMMKKMESK